jgi:hypothetical protein
MMKRIILHAALLPLSAMAAAPIERTGTEMPTAGTAQHATPAGKHHSEVREIHVKDLKRDDLQQDLTHGGFDRPVVIEHGAGLAKVFKDEQVKHELDRKVDFGDQKLLVFAWSGSGGDKLDYALEKQEVVFHFKPGLTKDLRPHIVLFSLNDHVKYRVEKE